MAGIALTSWNDGPARNKESRYGRDNVVHDRGRRQLY
jgi:hypothetical protein